MKKTPLRMCVACRQMKPKAQLIRVMSSEGDLTLDDTRKAGGRGAYVCRDESCIKKARKIRGFERALSAAGDIYNVLLEGLEETDG